MAQVKFVSDVASVSGRLCKKDAVCYALNKKTGKVYRYDYHGSTQPNTAAQQAVKTAFKTRVQYASAWWKANKAVYDSEGNLTQAGSANYLLIKAGYDAQSAIGNIYSYFLSLIDPDTNKVTISGTTIDITDATSTGGSSNPDDDDDTITA